MESKQFLISLKELDEQIKKEDQKIEKDLEKVFGKKPKNNFEQQVAEYCEYF